MLDNLFQEIFSSWTHKTDHFQRIHSRTGVPFKSMLFFDDEDRNIETVIIFTITCFLSVLVYIHLRMAILTMFRGRNYKL